MSHLNPSGTPTGSPRNKTALGPGKSLMDWVRLTNSGKDLSGTGGVLLNVTPEQLARHNKETDAWIAIGGIVYNVTEYLSFHPGGEAELMRGVGADATKLFNVVHSWVNYQSLLKSCIVGRLKTVGSSIISTSLPSCSSKKLANENISGLNSNFMVTKICKVPSVSDESSQLISKIDWFQQLTSVFLILYLKNSNTSVNPFQVSVSLNSARSLTVCIDEEIGVYELEDNVQWPCDVKVSSSRTEIRLNKENSKLWSIYGRKLSVSTVMGDFSLMKVTHISDVTHDTKLIGLQYEDKIIHYIHMGHHVRLKSVNSEIGFSKSYTPVSFLVPNDDKQLNASVFFLVKEYENGKLSRILCSLKVGDNVEMSKPMGTFNSKILEKRSNLVLLAAGTGFTPFTSLIMWGLRSTKSNIRLMFFNKTENDIIWKNDLDNLSSKNARFQVTYVLSQPSSNYIDMKGLVSEELLKSILIHPVENSYVCICGPIKFNELCVEIVKSCGYSENDFFCFQG